MMNLVAHVPKYPVYTFWYYACIKQTEMVQQSIYSLKTDIFSSTSHILSNIKTLGKEFVNKYNIEKCLQFNQVDFET